MTRTIRRRLARWLGLAIAAVILVPAAQAALLNLVDPPVTATMLVRSWEHGRESGSWRLPAHDSVELASLPHGVARAAVTAEDARFLEHGGFDREAIEKAWEKYVDREEGERLVGGSTISQQVAKNVFLCQHRSWVRKAVEAWYTVWLELLVPKRRILEVYLNVAEMGPMVFGIEAAAQHWYGKPASALSEREAAAIVAMLPSPRRRTPDSAVVQRKVGWILGQPDPLPSGW